MPKKIAIILAGCGYLDGSEINEVVLTLLAISKHKAIFEAFAPDMDQKNVVNHTTKQVMEKALTRNILLESARIVRGNVHDIVELCAEHYDALILPGGYGVLSNLSDFTTQTTNHKFSVNSLVEKAIVSFHKLKKPIGALCISPLLVAKILAADNKIDGLVLTTGKKHEIISTITNVKQQEAKADEVVIDEVNRIVTTPAFMLEAPLYNISVGIEKLVTALIDMSHIR